jgi:hypothetical protein
VFTFLLPQVRKLGSASKSFNSMVRLYQKRHAIPGEALLHYFLLGYLPGVTVQKWAEDAGDQGDPMCKKLAKIGDAGAHPKNCHRDIMLILALGCDIPQVYETVD